MCVLHGDSVYISLAMISADEVDEDISQVS